MPVTEDSYCYVSFSPAQNSHIANYAGHSSSSNSTAVNYESEYYRDDDRTSRDRTGSNYEPEQVRSPRHSPSLLRRINAAIKPKSSPSLSSARQPSPTRSANATPRVTNADPMYAAPSSAGPSRSSTSSMNPVSRFRRARNAEKTTRKQEHEVERKRSYPQAEWRAEERMNKSSDLSRSQSDARGYRTSRDRQEVFRDPGYSPSYIRTGSEATRDGGRTRHAPLYKQASEPIPHSHTTARSPARKPDTFETGYRNDNYLHSERHFPERSHTGLPQSNSSTVNPPRMGRFGIYASPKSSPAQVSSPTPQTNPAPSRTMQFANQIQFGSPSSRVEGWDVQIAPPTTSSQKVEAPKSRPSFFRRRPAQTRSQTSNSGSLTLVSEHPLMERPLPTPPEPPEPEKAEEFARNLTKRMSVLLELGDVDFTSRSALDSLPEDPACESRSNSTSGTVTPTGPSASQESTQARTEEPIASTTTNAKPTSPFGTFLTNAREMNEAFVQGTGSIWNKLFGKDKAQEKDKESATDQKQVSSDPSTRTNSQPEDASKDPKPEPEDADIEGSRDIMLYSPLFPDAGSVVSVAASEVVTLYGDGVDEARERAYRAELRRRWADGRGFISFDALSNIEPVQEETNDMGNNRAQAEQGQTGAVPDAAKTQEKQEAEGDAKPKPKEKVIWVPSPTQISVQVLWWGYRIYLPPPVLHVLNSRTIETAKRAALLTSALTWLLENLPFAALPPVLAPAALLLRALVPLIGMIGSFVAWGWKATVTFDRGNGVVLSATWVLPIVLVPGTWEDGETPPPAPMPPAHDVRTANGGVEVSRS